MLELYHSGLTQASVKVWLTLKEKRLDYGGSAADVLC
jgi:glutathione S-transferase